VISGYGEELDCGGQTLHTNAVTLTNVDVCHVIYEFNNEKFDAVQPGTGVRDGAVG
jgi:hypothetical protein